MTFPIDQKDMINFGSAQRKVAEYILANSVAVEKMGIRELAAANKVSLGSISNLCTSLGFDNFRTFKLELAKANLQARSLGKRELTNSVSQRVFNSFSKITNSLSETEKQLDIKAFEDAIKVIDKADRIVFFGIGGSGAIAMDARFRLLRLGINAVAYNDTQVQLWSTLTLNNADVVIIISHSGKTEEPIDALALAKSLGCTTIAVTSHAFSPLAKQADITLLSACHLYSQGEGSILARFSQQAIFDAIAEELIYRNPKYLRHSQKVESVIKARGR